MANKTFEDFEVGQTFEGTYRRTMTEAELVTVVHLAGLRTPLFTDEEWCKKNAPGGTRRFPGFLGIGVANSMCEEHAGSSHLGVRRLERVLFHGSFKPGDTLQAKGSVVKKDPGADPGKGTVTFNIRLYNQAEQLLLEFEPVFTMPKRGA